MMPEISLSILDVTENSVSAGAKLIAITVTVDEMKNRLYVRITDNGCGMSEQQVQHVTDPFYTTRTTRKVGLGIPFFQEAACLTGGSFHIQSAVGKGTTVDAEFVLDSIDRMPLGDMNGVICTLVAFNPAIDFVYTYSYNGAAFSMDTRQFREILGDVPLDTPEVKQYLADYLNENQREIDGGKPI